MSANNGGLRKWHVKREQVKNRHDEKKSAVATAGNVTFVSNIDYQIRQLLNNFNAAEFFYMTIITCLRGRNGMVSH